MSTADTILLRCTGRTTQEQWKEVKELAGQAGARGARGYGNAEETYVYFDLASPQDVKADAVAALEAKASALLGGAKVSGVALKQVADLKGASVGFPSPTHYVVEMEFSPGSTDEHEKWYSGEHLPGLASVTGCVRARRYMSAAGRSFACYDLASNLVPQTPDWQKWRNTALSKSLQDKHFNLKRGVFTAL